MKLLLLFLEMDLRSALITVTLFLDSEEEDFEGSAILTLHTQLYNILFSFHMVKMVGILIFLLRWLLVEEDHQMLHSAVIMHIGCIQDLDFNHHCYGEETYFRSMW